MAYSKKKKIKNDRFSDFIKIGNIVSKRRIWDPSHWEWSSEFSLDDQQRSGLKGLLGKTVPNEKPLQKSENFKQILEEDSILKQCVTDVACVTQPEAMMTQMEGCEFSCGRNEAKAKDNKARTLYNNSPFNNHDVLPDVPTGRTTSTTFTLLQGVRSKGIQSNKNTSKNNKQQLKLQTEGNFFLEAKQFGTYSNSSRLIPLSWEALNTQKYFENNPEEKTFITIRQNTSEVSLERISKVSDLPHGHAAVITVFQAKQFVSTLKSGTNEDKQLFSMKNISRTIQDDNITQRSDFYNDDFEQDYAEIDSFVWKNTPEVSLHSAMSPKCVSEFGNLRVSVSPAYVRNIQCMTNEGKLLSILSEVQKTEHPCKFAQRNDKYVKTISYPVNPRLKLSFENPSRRLSTIPQTNKYAPRKDLGKNDYNNNNFTRGKVQVTKSDPEFGKLKHSTSKDSLVTQSLLNLTSYEETNSSGQGLKSDRDGLSSNVLEDPNHENKMSFDDLEQVYKNISRRKILNKVQCSNIHFHAHSDGTTTLHRHKTCRRPSQEEIYGSNTQETLKKSEVKVKKPLQTKEKKESCEATYACVDSDENLYSSLEEEETGTSLEPLPVPPRNFNSQKNNPKKIKPSVNNSKSCKACSIEDTVCAMEGCIKFNPFYIRDGMEKTTGLQRFEVGPDVKVMSQNDFHQQNGGQALCGVVLDAVWHAGQVAAGHAGQSDCQHCREFSKRFESNFQGLFMPGYLPNIEENPQMGYRVAQDLEGGYIDPRLRPPYEIYRPHYPPPLIPHRRTSSSGLQIKMDRKIKLTAYISVVILAVLILIIVVVVLTLFFQREANILTNE